MFINAKNYFEYNAIYLLQKTRTQHVKDKLFEFKVILFFLIYKQGQECQLPLRKLIQDKRKEGEKLKEKFNIHESLQKSNGHVIYRMMSNRVSDSRSKRKQLQHISEMEKKIEVLQV